MMPEAVDPVQYMVSCYVSDSTGKKKTFSITSFGPANGTYGETSDKKAITAWEQIKNSDIFKGWREGFNDFDSYES